MDSLEEDSPRVNVRSLVSAFTNKRLSGTTPGPGDKGKISRTPQSTVNGRLSTKSEQSIELPLLFKVKQWDEKSSASSERSAKFSSVSKDRPYNLKDKQWDEESSASSERSAEFSSVSKDRPYNLKDKWWDEKSSASSERSAKFSSVSKDRPYNLKGKRSASSEYGANLSDVSKDRPYNLKGKQYEKPDFDYLDYMTVASSEDLPLKKTDVPCGIPKFWGSHVRCAMDSQRFQVQSPPIAVYQVLTADHRAAEDSREKVTSSLGTQKTKWIDFSSHPKQRSPETTDSSDTSDLSDEETVLNDDIEEVVICDICCEATAVKTCLTCNSSYCEYDIRQHYTVKSLQRHKLTDVCDEVEGKRCLHYRKALDYFCRTDQMPICSFCAQKNHSGHDIISQKSHRAAASQMSGADKYMGLPQKGVPPPGTIKFLSVNTNSVVLSWGSPQGLEGPKKFRVKWSCLKVECFLVIKDFCKVEINNLQAGQNYLFSVATEDMDGNQSDWVEASVFTAVPAPQHLTKEHSEATALSLKWTKPEDMEGVPHQYLITVTSSEKEPLVTHTEKCFKKFTDLKPDTKYNISVSTVLNTQCSEPISTTVSTEPCLREVLSEIGLEDHYDNKLTLSTVLEIDQSDTSKNTLETAKFLPEAVLKSLMMVNVNSRSVKRMSHDVNTDKSNNINPLDLITALFICSDGFLQQLIVMKMTLCQFALPLLLPNYETGDITLMLWSMREIVSSYSPSKQAFRKLSCEERLVLADIPLVSFVRLGKTTFSKSQMLNELLSSTQQHHDSFYHRNMERGDVPRRISDGLVEISWYLPCGNRNIDKFVEPLAVANLRGDIRAFDKQFSFLSQTSAAVYIFCDESELDYFKSLERKDVKANVMLISSVRGKTFTLKKMKMEPSFKITNVSRQRTHAELIKTLQESISKMLDNCQNKVAVENLVDRARWCGILVDEDSDECQSAWKNAGKITEHITNISDFKEKQLTSQGHIWKAISWVETECWRLRKAENQETDSYRKHLKTKENQLRKKQQRLEMTTAMSSFLHGMVTSEAQRNYFHKWLEMNLDNLSRNQMSALQNQYEEVREKFPQYTEKITEIDKQISACSLRLQHFFRECGQLYECASYLPEYSHQRKTMEQLPALCAQMLLDGFPLELVDGDAANIPMKWITQILTELHYILQSNSKLKVITIIGAENSGKTTLLNTMFGFRLAVGKGTCTRGSFIQLISVNKDVREELGCDCIMIIDTEGLKPHQVVQDDHSHERDMEVASLAVALSDATIVSFSGNDSSEKDILEMVLHAFTRLKDECKKPLCHFVQTNMSDMPAEERKNRGKVLVKQLNEMIRKDTKLKRANIIQMSDVMEFDPDTFSWYIPPIWSGTPPMAPLSVGYSETAHALRKQLIGDLKKRQETGDLIQFVRKVEKFWKAV